jgi:SAM-dependent methyltransferase
VSDRFRWTTIAHADRRELGPLSDASRDAVLADVRIAPGPAGRPALLDVGCGKGELLLHAMSRFGATGTGVDPNPSFLADARARAAALGLGSDATWIEGNFDPAAVPGPYDLVSCLGSTHAFGDLAAALSGMRALVRPDGWALVGTGYWKLPPAPGYLELLGASPDELPELDGAGAMAGDAGWSVVARHASTLEEWDVYEDAYAGAMRRWLEAHPDDADAPAFRARLEAWTGGVRRWGRDTMGFVTLLLRRDEPALR